MSGRIGVAAAPAWPGLSAGGLSQAGRLPFLSLICLWAGLLCFMLLSGNLLESLGWPYSLAGGAVLTKIHPGSYCILAGFAVLLAQANPVRQLGRMTRDAPAQMVFLLVVLTLSSYVLGRFGTAGSAFLFDVYVTPVLLGLLMSRLTPEQAARIFVALVMLLTLDAAIGIGEFALGMRLTPYKVDGLPVIEAYFRATALFGHPLQNALAMATGIMVLPVLSRHPLLALGAALLMGASLVPFGGRSALFVTLVLAALAGPPAVLRILAARRFTYQQLTGWLLLTAVMASGLLLAVAAFGDRTRVLSGLRWDASANTRLLGLRILDTVSPMDLMFGIGPVEVKRRTDLLGSYNGIIGLENSWLQLLLIFGGVGILGFVLSLFAWLRALLRGAPVGAWLAVVAFMVVASTNNTLSAKDTTLVLLVGLICGSRGYMMVSRAGGDRR